MTATATEPASPPQIPAFLELVTPELWELFSQPGVSLGTSWYSADADTHAQITGSRAGHARTAANIAEAVSRGIFVRAAIVEVTQGQDTQKAAGHLRALGVTDIRIRPQQDLGRAARDGNPATRRSYAAGAGTTAPPSWQTAS